MRSSKIKMVLVLAILVIVVAFSIPELTYVNKGESISHGKVSTGHLENAYLLPYRGKNFNYFSFTSYYLLNNAYTNSKVHNTVLDAYKVMETKAPGTTFRIMECSDKHGGKLRIHNTHRNGKSIDFMVPKKGPAFYHFNNLGMLHYLTEFDEDGKLLLNKNVEIDFEMMAQHIEALIKEGKKHNVGIDKVILKLNLKDNLFSTPTGKKLKGKVYFAKSLSKKVDDVHDDHYHIDFSVN